MGEVEPKTPGLWAPEHRPLTIGLFLTITFVASEALAVAPALPVVRRDLGGIALYSFVFTGFLLGSLVGTVLAGRETDRHGPTAPFLGGVALFVVGLFVGGLAPSMPVLVLGRILQGLGAGSVPADAYASINRSVPDALRPRMLAMLSTAWVLPGLFAPAVSAVVVNHFGWRWVFLGLVPFVVAAGALAVRGLMHIGPPDERPAVAARVRDALQAAAGAGIFLGGLSSHRLVGVLAVAAGLVIGVPPIRRLVPEGTLRARPGLPTAILSRGLLTFLFFGVDSYVPLAIQDVRDQPEWVTGVTLTFVAVLWSAGSWTQAHLSKTVEPPRLIRIGTAITIVGVAVVSLALRAGVPVATFVVGWAIAGIGMGLAYGPITLLVMREAPKGREGAVSASLTFFDTLGFAMGAGVAGAVIALTDSSGAELGRYVGIAFAIVAMAGVALLAVSPRLRSGTD